MTPKDIFMRALAGEARGRVAISRVATGSATSIVTTDLMREVGVSFPEAHRDAEQMARLAAAGHTELGFDCVMPLFSVAHEPAALGCAVDWGGPTQMPDARPERRRRVGEELAIPADFLDHEACRVPLRALEILKKRHGESVAVLGKSLGPWTLSYLLFGVEDFLLATLAEPDAVKRALAALKEVTVEFALAQVAAGADAVCIPDNATRDLCAPEAYEEFLSGLHRELSERIPVPLILHICGDTADRIGLIGETGFSCLHFDSRVPAGEARELAGERLRLMGGTSCLSVIREGTPETIAADVGEKLAAGIEILGPECTVPLDSPWRNQKVLVNEARRQSAR